VQAESGLLVPFDQPEAFVHAARSLAETPGQIAVLKHHARAAAESLSWEKIIDDLVEVLIKVADGETIDAAGLESESVRGRWS